MANLGDELASLDFSSLIGGPLVAIVNAQAQASLSSADFIKQVAFKPTTTSPPGPLELETVSFEYKKTGDSGVVTQTIDVPLISILNVPFIRVQEATIQFRANIVGMEFSQVDTSSQVGVELSAGLRLRRFSANLKASYASQKKSSSGEKTERTYAMDILVKIVQDEVPEGLSRVLDIFGSLIKPV